MFCLSFASEVTAVFVGATVGYSRLQYVPSGFGERDPKTTTGTEQKLRSASVEHETNENNTAWWSNTFMETAENSCVCSFVDPRLRELKEKLRRVFDKWDTSKQLISTAVRLL